MRTFTNQELKNLLLQPAWSYAEIMKYRDCSKPTAIRIKDRAIKEFKGGVPYGSHLAKTDSVLALFGTTIENEIKKLNEVVDGKENI